MSIKASEESHYTDSLLMLEDNSMEITEVTTF